MDSFFKNVLPCLNVALILNSNKVETIYKKYAKAKQVKI